MTPTHLARHARSAPAGRSVAQAAKSRKWLRIAGAVVLGIWFLGLVAFSTLLYHRVYLTEDFGAYNQAWTLIGQGHLNPYSTIFQGYPFIKSDFELIIWPLALIHLVFPQPIVLLWIQDLAVAASAYVVFVWILEFLEKKEVSWRLTVLIAIVVLAVLLVNPGYYQTVLFDVHMEPLSTPFVLLAGRDIWLGRTRRYWVWVSLALLCGTFAVVTLIGLGLSAVLAGKATYRQGILVAAAALVWLGFISLLGANAGSGLDSYAYLAGKSSLTGSTGIVVVLAAMLRHPTRVFDVLHGRFTYIYSHLKPAGVIGLASAWGFGVPVVVLLTNGLNSNYEFAQQAYQNSVVFPFLLLGTVMVLVWIFQRFRWGWMPALLLALVVSLQALTYGISTSPGNVRWAAEQVGAGPAAQLRRALSLTPSNAEVIATIGIMGRFSGRTYAYWYRPNGEIPVKSRNVIYVFDPANEDTIPEADAADDLAAIAYVRDTLHAQTLVDSQGIWEFLWRPNRGVSRITLPGPPVG